MKKTKVNQLLSDIDNMVECLMGHEKGCSNFQPHSLGCNCGFDDEKKIISEKLREVRAELGIWDK
jgi:hypothetical protein